MQWFYLEILKYLKSNATNNTEFDGWVLCELFPTLSSVFFIAELVFGCLQCFGVSEIHIKRSSSVICLVWAISISLGVLWWWVIGQGASELLLNTPFNMGFFSHHSKCFLNYPRCTVSEQKESKDEKTFSFAHTPFLTHGMLYSYHKTIANSRPLHFTSLGSV